MIGLILFWTIVILYTIWLYRQHAAKSENEPPALPGALPLIGNAHHMIGDSLCKYLVKNVVGITRGLHYRLLSLAIEYLHTGTLKSIAMIYGFR